MNNRDLLRYRQIKLLIKELSITEQKLLELRKEYNMREISDMINIKISTLYRRETRAIEKLKDLYLEKHFNK